MAKNSPQDVENKMFFSSKLNRLLESHDKKQIDLANDLDIPKSTLTGYVKGTSLPTLGNLQKLADYFGVKKSDLDLRFISEDQTYYTNPTTAKMAQEIFDDPNLRILMDASRDLEPDDLQLVIDMVKRMKKD